MSEFEDVKQHVEMIEAATQHMREDPRFRQMVDSTVSHVMNRAGRVDPENADEEAFDRAREAAAMILARVYVEDAEIRTLADQRDRYKELAEEGLRLRPMPQFVSTNNAAKG